ncbi:type I-C CRISPR-associated protein Cas7/Csd2 [Methanoculleus sp.]|uniref:type I-C CRISPR-associated protein Cas7/Csd2 n=1 Tax=Methanoculleus sp. TaxID=90427 RepID=UPI0025FA795D|nr:type I-C CRISPR-associated protein Cas7/Csd2 [Methanoculleus sp.]
MTQLENKIDFAVIVSAKNANPNGDPLNGNCPRTTYEGIGEMSDVCIKRKIRNRLQDMDNCIFVQSVDRRSDNYLSLKARADGCEPFKKALTDGKKDDAEKLACERWIDVRSFGQVFAYKAKKPGKKASKKQDSTEVDQTDNSEPVSIGIRGPVSIHPAFSVDPVEITALQITKSVNGETNEKDPYKKAPDTMGMKYRVDFGMYVFYGSINCQLAEKTGFSTEDAESIRKALVTLFENDSSSARPEGSMEVCKVFWWKHNSRSGQYSSAKVHRTLHVLPKTDVPKSIEDYEITVDMLEGLEPEIFEGT